MAAAVAVVVGEALLSASVEALVGKISAEISDFNRSKKLDKSLLEKLNVTLLSLHAVLNDAEEKQIRDNTPVREWMNELTQALFDADDLIDDIATEALRRKVEANYRHRQTVTAKVRKVLSSPFKRPYREINSQMQQLFERLDHFEQRSHNLQLKRDVSRSVWRATPTNSAVDDSAICGRDDEKQNLRKYLLSEDAVADGDSKLGVLAIVGMGGLGKTTLAKLLYNDAQVREKFDVKAWTSVPKDFDVVKLARSVLESVTSAAIKFDNLDTLRAELQRNLSGKRFLLVLDDIWNAGYVDWTDLMHIFNVGKMGSKIIVTTRHEDVVDIIKAMRTCRLEPLANEDCWTLLSKHAFGAQKCIELSSNLEEIGRKIAKKCGGLPLAAVAVGGLLGTKLSTEHWTKVLKSNIWDLTGKDVQPALLLSYHFLPPPLKQCFAYCSIFPKNSELQKENLVQLWMAEGFVYVSPNQKSIEEVGGEYFEELVARSLIRRSVDGKNFEMHDLLNDLATTVSSPYCKRKEDQKPLEHPNKIRHLSYNKGRYDHFDEFDSLYGLKGLRTLLALPFKASYDGHFYLANEVVHDVLQALRQLRVLSLSNYSNIRELPSSIGNLKHLRYLNLSYTGIKRLPPTICNLFNLQTLLLFNCSEFKELPEDIAKLVNLRHLDIDGTLLKEIPVEIAKLENLHTLTRFIVSNQDNGLKLAEIRKFPHLQGKLCISKLENVIDPLDACQANLKEKELIEELSLQWSGDSINEDSQLVLEHLQPSTNLKSLTIQCYGGNSFPNWLGHSSFDNIVHLRIMYCCYCSSLPPLGQLQSLKELFISGMTSVKAIGSEFYGSNTPSFQPFPSLETLSFVWMEEWEEWNLIDGIDTEFPRLSKLSLVNCPKLRGNLPHNLPCLLKLEVEDCSLLESQFKDEVDHANITRPLNLFSEFILHLRSLQELRIQGIPSLTSLPSNGLPKTLKKLAVKDCENLEFPTHEFLRCYKALEDLKIESSCCSLMSFPLGTLPVLKNIELIKCKNLNSVSVLEKGAIQSLVFLQSLTISDCPKLESISLLELPAPNLRVFHVMNCNMLKSLPEPINNLTSLIELWISGLPSLQSVAEEGLPISIRSLSVGNDVGIFSNTDITKWSLERLTFLSHLDICGDYLIKNLMKMEVPVLPNSLETLWILNLRDTHHLDGKWLQNLTSLKSLLFSDCAKLKSLPEEGLPSSISQLIIEDCPLLEASCQKNTGKEWPKIAHIPRISDIL